MAVSLEASAEKIKYAQVHSSDYWAEA